jgi:NAD(P)-dependent dehydrogenase (short-subunit alcohol dehydrogenase family)
MANILITGATAGIGRAAAILLAKKGHTVIGTGRDAEALARLDATAVNLHAFSMDVTDAASVAAAAERTRELLGEAPLDVLVNNAGFAAVGPVEDLPIEDWQRQYETNVIGVLRVVRTFLPAMRERGRGRIVNVSSVAGHVTLPFFGPYNSSKHALESISDALRLELAPHGIQVVVVEPGPVKTGFGASERAQLQAMADELPAYREQLETMLRFNRRIHGDGADPTRVAGTLVTACLTERPHARYVTPALPNRVFIALKKWLPTAAVDWILKRMTGLDRVSNR